jgi:L-alanine-DL-glutamate epimerase-like enolase superfamily enzyme
VKVCVETRSWRLREPFAISRGVQEHMDALIVVLEDGDGLRGRGEASPVDYAGETLESVSRQALGVRGELEAGADRRALLELLPPGAARCAVDAALWDLEAKREGVSAFALAGIEAPRPVETTFTIGIRSPEEYERAAQRHAAFSRLKLKVAAEDALKAVEAARRGAPGAEFIVDPNQSWSIETLKRLGRPMAELGVVLLEQPIAVGAEARLEGYCAPVALCADELIDDVADLDKALGLFDVINIKLEKAGGLTNALKLAEAAREAGFELMVGCMGGSSLAMAPALVLAQQCRFVDLDGPLLQAEDWPEALRYEAGLIHLPGPELWG